VTLLLKRILTEPRRQPVSGRRAVEVISGTTSAGGGINQPAVLVHRIDLSVALHCALPLRSCWLQASRRSA
jgi:hypothetical protein